LQELANYWHSKPSLEEDAMKLQHRAYLGNPERNRIVEN
jgi:hypothetical protein